MFHPFRLTIVLALALFVFVGCEEKPASPSAKTVSMTPAQPLPAELLVELPTEYNTPDGLCLLPDNSILLSVPNINVPGSPAYILKITPGNKIEKFLDPPTHPDTGKAFPFGICYDKDSGDVFYADLQWFDELKPNWLSRVMRIKMKDGKPVGTEVVASGMIVANAVVVKDGYLYVSDTSMVPDAKPLVSGVYKIKLGEGEVKLTQPLEKDPHLIATITSHNPDVGFGADGLCFDKHGNLYIGNFADGTMHKVTFGADGKPTTPMPAPIWAKADFMKSCDGLQYDARTDTIIVADSIANAVQVISLDGKVTTLSQEATDDGANGKFDQPCEALRRGDEVIVSNFDFPVPGGVNQKYETPNCISVIKLKP